MEVVPQSNHQWRLRLSGCLAIASLLFSTTCAIAQNITLDGTLGPAQTLTGPIYLIRQADGTTVGSNLFHSFGRFNLSAGEVANFQSAANIRNILSRVTGGSASSIDGLIFTQSPNVNLFLMNPSGIIFGPNARLDIGGSTRGSFVATTVDALVWSNGARFSATNPGRPDSLLSIVGDPSGFLASQRFPQPITVSGSTLRVAEGQSLLLLGGNVTLDNGFLSVDLFQGGRIELGGLAEPGIVRLNTSNNLLHMGFSNDVVRADISIRNGSFINVMARSGGNIAVNAQNLDILDESILLAGIRRRLDSTDSQAGDITIDAKGTMTVSQASLIQNSVQSNASGSSGNILITAKSLLVNTGARIAGSTFGQGNAGNLTISTERISLDGESSNGISSGIYNLVAGSAIGNAGNTNITTDTLIATNGAQLGSTTYGQGNSGNVIITANHVFLDGEGSQSSSGIFSSVSPGSVGNGGDISITTRELSVTNGGAVSTATSGRGNAGNVRIQADVASFNGEGRSEGFPSGVFSGTTLESDKGDGGNISITIRSLAITRGSLLFTSTVGQGNAGNVIVRASDTVFIDGEGRFPGSFPSSISSAVLSPEATGAGGSIDVTARLIILNNRGELSAVTGGKGDAGSIILTADTAEIANGSRVLTSTTSAKTAGDITLKVSDRLTLSGESTGLFANTLVGSTGDGGNIFIYPRILTIQDGAKIAVDSQGNGIGGNIQIQAETLDLSNRAAISAETTNSQGGNIALQIQNLLSLRRGGQISTTAGTAQAGGDGGNIQINAPFIIAIPSENSDITANAFTGRGGRVEITVQGIFGIEFRDKLTAFSDITASSEFGIAGVVNLNTPDVDPSRGLVPLPVDLVDVSRQIVPTCRSDNRQGSGRFFITGRGGLPPNPTEPLSSGAVLTADGQPFEPAIQGYSGNRSIDRPPNTIVEAQGWVIDTDGTVVLVAQIPQVSAPPPWQPSPDCGGE